MKIQFLLGTFLFFNSVQASAPELNFVHHKEYENHSVMKHLNDTIAICSDFLTPNKNIYTPEHLNRCKVDGGGTLNTRREDVVRTMTSSQRENFLTSYKTAFSSYNIHYTQFLKPWNYSWHNSEHFSEDHLNPYMMYVLINLGLATSSNNSSKQAIYCPPSFKEDTGREDIALHLIEPSMLLETVNAITKEEKVRKCTAGAFVLLMLGLLYMGYTKTTE